MKVQNVDLRSKNGRQERLYKAKMALNKLTLEKIGREVGFSTTYISKIIKGYKYNQKVIDFLDDLPGLEA